MTFTPRTAEYTSMWYQTLVASIHRTIDMLHALQRDILVNQELNVADRDRFMGSIRQCIEEILEQQFDLEDVFWNELEGSSDSE